MRSRRNFMTMLAGGAAPSPLLTNLAAYWKLDEASDGSGAITRVDSVGAHHLTDNSPFAASVAGVISNGVALVGANTEYLSTAATASLLGGARSWSMDFWFKVTDRTVAQEIFSKGTHITTASLVDFRFFLNTTNMFFRVSNGTAVASTTLGAAPANDTWCYVYVQHDYANSLIQGAINNGALTAGTAYTASAGHNPAGDMRFGLSSGGTLPMTGALDEVARWNRLLTETERLDRWNNGSGSTYPF